MRIGIFDSGIGGINVLSSLIKKYPHNQYIYYGDTKNLPYGDKNKKELFTLASHAIDFLLTKKVEMIIIACGTISSTCYAKLKKKYNFPIYDIISPTIEYLQASPLQKIGIIGTSRTIESNIFHLEDKDILMKKTPSFVPIIENNEIMRKESKIIDELKCFKDYDCLVLGCTHYPLLKPIIDKSLHIQTIDMGECLVNKLILPNNDDDKIELYFTLISVNLIMNIERILPLKYEIWPV